MGTWSIQGNNAYIQSSSVTGDNLSVVFKPNSGNTQQGSAQNFTITYNDNGNVTTTSYTLPYCYVPAPEQHEDMFEVNFNTLPQGFEYSNTGDTHTVLVTSGTWSESTQNYVFSPVNISFLNSDGLSFAADSRGSGGGITRSYSVHLSESPENRAVEGIEMKIQQANNPSNYSSQTFNFRAEEVPPTLPTNIVTLLYGYNNNGVFVGVLERQNVEDVSLTYGGGYHVSINKTCTDSAESLACPASQNYGIKAAGVTIQTNSSRSDAFPFFGINGGGAQTVPQCCIGQADGDQVTNPTMTVTLSEVPDADNAIELEKVNGTLIRTDGYDSDEYHYDGFVTNSHYAILTDILKGKVYSVQYTENNSAQTTYVYDFDNDVYIPSNDGYEICTSITDALSSVNIALSNITAIQQFSPKLGELVGNQLQINADGTLTETAVLDDDMRPSSTRAMHIELDNENNN